MNSLKDLEKDVHRFLINLARVRKVDVTASVDSNGKKSVAVTTFVEEGAGSRADRNRVYVAEEYIMDRHANVTFDFSCATLKEKDEQRSVGTV